MCKDDVQRCGTQRPKWRPRKGAVIALIAVMMPVFVGLAALSADIAVLAAARSQMQTVSDAAALSAVRQLASDRRVEMPISLATEITAAHARLRAITSKNRVLGQAPVLNYTTGVANGADVVFGFLDWKQDTTTLTPDHTAAPSTYNSVRIFARRDSTHGGGIPNFFAALFGQNSTDIEVSSTATVQLFRIAGFSAANNQNARLLPIVLSKPNYDAMIAGTTADQYSYNTTTGAVTSGADGVKESVLYPVSAGNAGNWGTIKVGVSNNSTSTLGSQIRDGVTPAQMINEFPPNGNVSLNQYDSATSTYYHTFSGNPGISSGIKDDLTAIIGKPVSIPIYDLTGGNGNNAWYRVIAFASVRIVSVNFQGNPKYVVIQPAINTDPTAVKSSTAATWQEGGMISLFLSR